MTSSETLRKWAAKTLEERSVLFHRKFPEVTASKTTIATIYKLNGIKRKAIVLRKTPSAKALREAAQKERELCQALTEAVRANKKIFYLDEVSFTK